MHDGPRRTSRRLPWAIAGVLVACCGTAPLAGQERIVVAGGDRFEPYLFRNADGKPDGMDADLWRLWSRKAGVAVELRLMDWAAALPALRAGEVDVVTGVSYTPQRAEYLDFTEPYATPAVYLYFHENLGGVRGLDDLAGFPVGVIKGSNVEEYLRAHAPKTRLVPYLNYQDMVEAAANGGLRVLVGEETVVPFFLAKLDRRVGFRRTGEPLLTGELRMAVRKGDGEMLSLVEEGLRAISEAERRRIRESWAGVELWEDPPWQWVLGVAGTTALLLILLATWNAQLRRRVARATRTLADSEKRLRALVETTSDWIWEIDRDGVYTYASPRVREILGYAPEEIVDGTPFDLMPPPEAERVRKGFQEAANAHAPLERVEFCARHRDGRTVVLETSAVPILDEAGALTGYRGIDRDITARKRAEELMRAQRDLGRALSAARTLREGLRLCVETALRLSGLDCAGIYLVEKDTGGLELVYHTGLSDSFVQAVRHCAREDPRVAIVRAGEPVYTRLEALDVPHSPDEMSEGLRSIAFVPFRHEGAVIGCLNVASRQDDEFPEMARTALETVANQIGNAIERLRAEESLARAQGLLEAAVEQTPAGVLVADAPDVRIRLANAAALGIRGQTDQVLTEIPVELHPAHWQTYHEDGTPYAPEDLPLSRAVLRGETVRNETVIIRRGDGEDRWVLANAAPVRNKNGQTAAGVVVFADITDLREAEEQREQLEAQLRQAQKMEAVGQLAGGVAHDFNNLLQAIQGYTELSLGALPKDHETAAYLQEVKRASTRAASLTRQLLAFSRRETLQPKHVDLNEVTVGVMKMLRRVLGEQIELTFVPGPALRAVYADPGQLEQVLMNLCVNARDAMPGGGSLRIETGNVELDAAFAAAHPWARPGTFVRLGVTDTGMGMSDDVQDRIFEPFFTTKEVGEGTGLGLATVYGIVKQHDGLIEVRSVPGRGATFRVYLPSSRPAPVGDREDAPRLAEAGGGSETLLLAEDDDLVRRLAVTVLTRAGYRLLVARDGAEAIGLLEEDGEAIDLAVLDVVMPRKSGREVYEAVKARDPRIPVLFCSGYSYSALDAHLPDGAGAIIQKPYEPQDLLRQVRAALDARKTP